MNISSKVNTLDGLMRSVTIKVDKAEYINALNKDLNKYKKEFATIETGDKGRLIGCPVPGWNCHDQARHRENDI